MSFTSFKNKPASSKVILFEFATSVTHSFFLNEEPGIWRFDWRVEADTSYNFENGAFCYQCFENGCLGLFDNDNPILNFISLAVDGDNYSKVTGLVNLRATNKSFWWDSEVIHIHFDGFAPPWIFTTINLGASVNVATKAGVYNSMFFDSRLKSVSVLVMKVDPLFYGVLGYGGLTAKLINNDGEYDDLTALDLFGQTVNIRYGEEGAAYTDFELVYSGIIQDFKINPNEFILKIKDKRKRFRRSVPENFFLLATYPDIEPRNVNKVIPLAYGYCDNVPVICTNEEEVAPSTYEFKICDTTYHPIKAITEVRVEGVAKTPTTSSLANATFELSTSDYSPGDDVNADIQGYESSGVLIENALKVIIDILVNYADIAYTSDAYDTVEWAAAEALAPDIQYFINESVRIESVVAQICVSLNGVMFPKANGKFSFRYLHRAKSILETIPRDEQLADPKVEYPSNNFLSSVVLTYDMNYGEEEPLTHVDASEEQSLDDTYRMTFRFEATTLLNSLADVQTLATNLIATYAKIVKWATIKTDISHIQLELLDDATVNLDRESKAWLGDVDARVYKIKKDVMKGSVEFGVRAID